MIAEIARGGARQGWLTLAVAVPPRSEGKISKSNKETHALLQPQPHLRRKACSGQITSASFLLPHYTKLMEAALLKKMLHVLPKKKRKKISPLD